MNDTQSTRLRVILLRCPRYVWPFNSETSAFWQPLGLLCAAAAVRAKLPDVDIQVWDAPGMHWGWSTLERKLASERIDVLGIGEETCSAHEGLRAAGLVKQLHPGCVVVAGGVHFSHDVDATLADGRVDVIVRGEAEQTFVELLENIKHPEKWPDIPGLAFPPGVRQFIDAKDGSRRRMDIPPGVRQAWCGTGILPVQLTGWKPVPHNQLSSRTPAEIVITPARPLIHNLDSLPTPAYDLIDMSRYGRGSRNHPDLVSIEHSRGCVDSCSFCILWKQMGESVDGNGQVRPCYRTKSAERSFEEVAWLHKQFRRRTFGWVDPTFNGSPEWSDAWAERMLASPLVPRADRPKTLHTAWVRADGIIRDEKMGILAKLVRAGLRQVMIGVERDDARGIEFLGKHRNGADICQEAIAILREKYPQVFTIGSMIFGLPGDTTADLDRLVRWQDRLGLDYCFFIPLTPNPGTAIARHLKEDGCPPIRDTQHYDFHTPVCATHQLDLNELQSIYWRTMLRPSPQRLTWAVRELLLQRDRRKRRVSWALLGHGARVALSSLRRSAFGRRGDRSNSLYSRKPSWYDT